MKRTIGFRIPILCFFLILVYDPPMLWVSTLLISSHAQVTPTPGAGGLGTTVTQTGSTYHITGGTRPNNGPNLFHSFGEFGVPTNHIANFLNETSLPTSNILGRVTGGNPSNIFGTIQTTGFGNANLFLMNPAGIVFGPNASLNVGGSVGFTTADYLRLADGAHFNALPGPMDAAISSAPVAAFGFLGSNPGAITVQGGQLVVAPGQSMSLVGGDIAVQGVAVEEGAVPPTQLSAPGGKIALASAASPGEILAETLETAPNLNGQSFASLGTIQISRRAVLDSTGDGGGTVLVRGGRFVLDDSIISAKVTGPGPVKSGGESIGGGVDIQVSQDAVLQNGALIDTSIIGNASPLVQYGGVLIKSDNIEVRGILDFDVEIFIPSAIRSNIAPGSSAGRSGSIELKANSIRVQDLGEFQTLTSGAGDAGDIVLTANENIDMMSFATVATGSVEATGNAGNIVLTSTNGNISTDSSTLRSQAVFTSGNSGSIMLTAPHGDILLSSSEINNLTFHSGALGGMQFAANNLTLAAGTLISGLNFDPLAPGNIVVTLPGNLSLSGNSRIETVARGPARAADLTITAQNTTVTGDSSLSTESKSSGPGGHLNILTDSLTLTTGGQIKSPSSIGVDPDVGTPVIPSGAGGTINIQGLASPARSVVIDGAGSGIFTGAVGTGSGGNANISAQSVTIQNGGTISASSTGPADAGNININAGSQFLSNNGSVTTQASQASGGNITVQATDAIRLVNSRIDTSVQGGPNTAGGNITLDPSVVTLQNSQVRAEAVQGQGGNINIVAGTFLADQTSLVSASSQFGLSGTVNIQSPVSSLSGTLATLPQRPLQVHNLLSQRCAAQATGQLSSLVVAGRDTLPGEPGGWLMSPLAWMPDEAPIQQTDRTGSIGATLQSQAARPGGDQLSDLRQLDVAGCGS